MNAIDIEKLNQLISRTDISGNDKVRWLEDFISGRELQQQERMYSEADIKQAYLDGCELKLSNQYHVKEWFEQFKHK